MTHKRKWIIGSIVVVAGLASLPLLTVLLFAVSNAVPAVYYYVFTTQPSNQELAGKYTVQLSWGTANLSIRPDYTFEETVTATGNSAKKITGHWTVESADNGHTASVSFKPFISVQDNDHGQQYDYSSLLFNKPLWGQIFAEINPDSGYRFRKQPQQEAYTQ